MMLAFRVSLNDFSALSPGANVVGGATIMTPYYKELKEFLTFKNVLNLTFLIPIIDPSQ